MDSLITVTDLALGVRQIRLNRPERKNALTTEMYIDLERSLLDADSATEVRVILLTGDSQSFCAGNDIEDFLQQPPQDEHSPVFRFLRSLNKIGKPIVAAVNGPAVGIGTTMLLHCDLVYASASAVFRMPFVSLGCTPEGGSSLLLPNTLGQRQAAELLLLGNAFDASRAQSAGIITAVSANDDALVDALKAAQQLASQPPAAVREAKKIMKRAMLEQIDDTIVHEGRLFSERLKSPEASEALSAFTERRKPDFSRFN